jgi:hypothetical protein
MVSGRGVMQMSSPYKVLSSKELMHKMNKALDKGKPLSVVSVGATETFVMAQYIVLSEEELMAHPQAISTNANKSQRGFRFPNIVLQDEMISSVKQADIVAYPLTIRSMDAGLMTEKVFQACNIKPKYVYEALIRRVLYNTQKNEFERMLRRRRILLIGRMAEDVRAELEKTCKSRLGFDIVGTIGIEGYEDVPKVKHKIGEYSFDLCLLSAGVYSVILAPYIAITYGKVAFDMGQGMQSLVTGQVAESKFVRTIGMKRLLSM